MKYRNENKKELKIRLTENGNMFIVDTVKRRFFFRNEKSDFPQ